MADIKYSVSVDSTGAVKSVETLDQAFAKLKGETIATGKTTDETSSRFGGLWKQFAIGQIAVNLLHKGWQLLKDQISESVKGAMEAEKANAALDAALLITGRGAAQLGDHFKRYADELMKSTVYDDEAIKSTQALLIQLTRLDKEGIDQATRGAIGLASALGMDLSSAATIVAKAMAGNVSVLSRYGIYVSESLPLEEKRAQLLEKLNVLYGRATAETETFSGRLAQLKVRWGEVQEAAGGFITRQQGVIDILDKASQAVLDYLTMGKMLEDATRSAEEQENRRTEWLGKAAAAAGWQYQQMAKLIETYGGVTPALLVAINAEIHGIEIKREYQRVIREERAAWIELEAARKKAETGTGGGDLAGKMELLATAIDALPWGKHRAELAAVETWLRSTTVLIEGQLPAIAGYSGAVDTAARHTALLRAELERLGLLPKTIEKLKVSFEQIAAAAQQVFSSFDAVFSQAQRNREIAIENEYKKRLAYINANVKDESARQKAIIALEAEFQIKKTEAAAAGAKQAKAVAMMEAVVNTASAVVSALKVFPPWLGIAFASVIGALGAVQIGLIAKQPIPLARGAVFTKSTLLPARYEVAEAGEPEIVSPKSTIRDAVREAWTAMMPQMALAGAGGATVNLYLTGPLIEAHGWSDSELRAGSDKLLAYVNEGLRKLGRKQL
jgi:hypothetical protein